eukprot:1604393-Pyramimonas_sp.AAC.1
MSNRTVGFGPSRFGDQDSSMSFSPLSKGAVNFWVSRGWAMALGHDHDVPEEVRRSRPSDIQDAGPSSSSSDPEGTTVPAGEPSPRPSAAGSPSAPGPRGHGRSTRAWGGSGGQ